MRQRTLDALGPEERRTWAAARVWAAHQAPYLASALLSLDPVVIDQSEDPPQHRFDLDALPVDLAWHVYLDPEVLGGLDVPTVGFWLIHQVSHLLRHHGERYPGGARPRRSPRCPQPTPTNSAGTWPPTPRSTMTWWPEARRVPTVRSPRRRWVLPDAWTAEQYWDALGPVEAPATEPQPGSQPAPSSADCGSGCDGQDRPWDSGAVGTRRCCTEAPRTTGRPRDPGAPAPVG